MGKLRDWFYNIQRPKVVKVEPVPQPPEIIKIDPDGKYIFLIDGDVPRLELDNFHKRLKEWMASDETFMLIADRNHITRLERVA